MLLVAHAPAKAGQAAPPAGGQAGAGGRLDARALCDIGAKSQFKDAVTNSVPAWEAAQSACYGSRQLSGNVRNVNLIVHGTGGSDSALRNTIQIFFTTGGEELIRGADVRELAIPLLRAFFSAAGEAVPDELLRDIGAGIGGRMGTARVPVDTAFGATFYKITMHFPGRTIE